MKKVLAVLLAGSMMMSLAGCGGTGAPASGTKGSEAKGSETTTQVTEGKAEKTEGAGKTQEPQVLNIYSSVMKEEATAEMFAEFEKENNVKVKSKYMESSDFVQGFMVAANGGADIDLMILNGQDMRAFVQKGLVKSIDSYEFKDRFIDTAIAQCTFDGKLYGIPAKGGNSSGIYYNLDVLNQYGLKVPTNLAELSQVNKTLKENGKSMFAFGGGNKYMWPMWLFSTFAQTSGNKSLERTEAMLTGQAKFTDPDYVEALTILQGFAKEEMFQPGFIGADADGGKTEFVNGNTAAFYGGTWEIDSLRTAGLKNLELAKYLSVKDGTISQQTGAACDGVYAVYSKIAPEREELVKSAIEFITRDENLKIYRESATQAVRECFVFTPSKNVPLPEEADVLAKTVQNDLYPVTVTFLDWIYPPEVTTALQDALQELMGQQITPEEAAGKVQAAFDEAAANGYDFNAIK